MARFFVALDLPEEVKDALLDAQSGMPGARWRYVDDLHLTLAFIGEMTPPECRDIADALAGVTAPAFDLTLTGAGYFGDRKPRALWIGISPSDPLAHLQEKVEIALLRAGAQIETRKFKPHVTLAYLSGRRLEEVQHWCAAHNLYRDGPFSVDAFHLFESHLGRHGAQYEIRATYPLSRST